MDVGTTEAAKKGRLKVEFLENGAGAEAPLSHFQQLAARLKSCPDTKPVKATVGASFSAACTAGLPPHRPPRGCPPVGGDPGSPPHRRRPVGGDPGLETALLAEETAMVVFTHSCWRWIDGGRALLRCGPRNHLRARRRADPETGRGQCAMRLRGGGRLSRMRRGRALRH